MRFPHISKRDLMAWAGLLMLVFVIAGVVYCCDANRERKMEKRAFAALGDSQDPLVLEDFIARYPKSEHVEEVRQRYMELVAEQTELEARVMNASCEELKTFVTAGGGNQHLLRLANARIDTMDWREATAKASSKSMERYISEHPDGAFIAEAVEEYNKYECLRLEAELAAQRDTTDSDADGADTLHIEFSGANI